MAADDSTASAHSKRNADATMKNEETPIFVVIPFKGKVEMTNNLVNQLLEQNPTNQTNLRQIYLMNNGESQSFPWGEHPNCSTIECKGMNIHQMWNLGISISSRSTQKDIPQLYSVMLLNNDTKIDTSDYLQTLERLLRSADNIAAVSSSTGQLTPQQIETQFEYGNEHNHIRGDAFMIKGELPFRFDERYIWYYGEMDYICQIENSGYLSCISYLAHHTPIDGGSNTIREFDYEYFNRFLMNDQDIFYHKWPQVVPPNVRIPRQLLRTR